MAVNTFDAVANVVHQINLHVKRWYKR